MAKDTAPLAAFAESSKAIPRGAQEALMREAQVGGYPYKTVTKNAEENVQSEMVLVSTDAKSPDDALFEIPADCKKLRMPAMPAEEQLATGATA